MSKSIAVDERHVKRVRAELVKAGMTSYGLLKGETRHLPEIIHETEHIGGVVYGRYEGGSGMIVATDKRILFMDHKPFYRSTDEIHYDVVSGISINKQDGTAGVVMHTRLGDYKLSFVNAKCASHFARFMEDKADELLQTPAPVAPKDPRRPMLDVVLSQPAKHFLWNHEIAVLSTVDESGGLRGSVVYYASDKNDNLFFVSKHKTMKVKNIARSPQVALTMYDEATMQALQVSGMAHIEEDPEIISMIEQKILHPRFRDGRTVLPPILHLPAGKYVVVSVKPTSFTFSDYKG